MFPDDEGWEDATHLPARPLQDHLQGDAGLQSEGAEDERPGHLQTVHCEPGPDQVEWPQLLSTSMILFDICGQCEFPIILRITVNCI